MNSLADGETIKINMTPSLPGGVSVADTKLGEGYTLGYEITDVGESTKCDFTATSEVSKGSIYLELVTATGSENYRLKTKGEPETMECYWAQGGSVRLMKRRWLHKDKELVKIDLPYANGANFNFTISKSTAIIDQ